MPLNPDLYDGPAYVVRQDRLAPNCMRMTLAAPVRGPVAAGQFAHLRCDETSFDPLLRRPFTFWDVQPFQDAWTNLTLVYTVVGKGTALLAEKQPLDSVGFLGPLGHGFTPRPDRDLYLFVAGGVGIAPFYHFTRQLRESGDRTRRLLLFGARTESMLYGIDEFPDVGVEVHAATDDGSRGRKGMVTDLMRSTLRHVKSKRAMVYACGPDPMLREVMNVARTHDLPCEVSMERRMGCALGACGACVTKVTAGEEDWRYSRICWEGPTYDAAKLVVG
ncbi:MAG: dihydroorotate dehydrogenase electron transfer subunit [Planctomycetes bacterium]|nr:dihydroorotate dehydrogenase electron transfer subunit [Planctomycetota bacterium]